MFGSTRLRSTGSQCAVMYSRSVMSRLISTVRLSGLGLAGLCTETTRRSGGFCFFTVGGHSNEQIPRSSPAVTLSVVFGSPSPGYRFRAGLALTMTVTEWCSLIQVGLLMFIALTLNSIARTLRKKP